MENLSYREGKNIAIISYITIIGTVIAIFMNLEPKNDFARFHIRQAFGLNIGFYAIGILISQFDSWTISMGFYVAIVVLWVYGFAGAVQERKTLIPLLGEQFQKWFSFIK
ncbi:hypothetical protein GTQ40_05825 [Flavobacteriaceae bacterium R38]|nr:hypothetical protein [Flavobacteriaceae bacterium R38]